MEAIITIVGFLGSVKTTLSRLLKNNYVNRGYKPFILLFFIISNNSFSDNSLDSLYTILNQEMINSVAYNKTKELRIANLNIELKNSKSLKDQYEKRKKLIDEYQYYNLNKAIENIEINLTLAKQLDDLNLNTETLLKFTQLLISSGQYKESIDILNQLNKNIISEDNIIQYYKNYADGYSRLSYYTIANDSKNKYFNLYNTYKDSLVTYFDKNSEFYLDLEEKKFRDNGQIADALTINDQRLKLVNEFSRQYSIIRFERSFLYSDAKNKKINLILSAISDIRLSIKDNASLTDLAKISFQENDLDKAYRYINFSYEDAEFYNSLHRKTIISSTLPLITRAYESRSFIQKNELEKLLFISVTLGFILLISLLLIYKQVKRISKTSNQLKLANNNLTKIYDKLSNSDRIKERYLGTFLNLYSDYINHLDMYRKMVRNHITSNKYKALLDLTKSKQIKDNELKIFYKNFDEAFLKIYPNYVTDFNSLMKENHQFILNNKNELNTELRIFALVRIGISSSSKISKILRYSVNTIYNYRAGVKNNSIDREDFELF
ncbi:DUF6377 domain-containing protein, partial [Flavobacteriaceae bacterium]|nr:DUF6377 domain-containing protein [Flavobacteriaceae bacterium]